MTKNIKVMAALIVAGLFVATAFRTEAYPPFVRKAEKFGAKDCLFCHTEPQGGEGWNERGKWLITEKDKRKADSIDLEWLAEYKPADASATPTTGETKEGDAKEGETKEDGTKEGDTNKGDTNKGESKSEVTKPAKNSTSNAKPEAKDSTSEKDKVKEKRKEMRHKARASSKRDS